MSANCVFFDKLVFRESSAQILFPLICSNFLQKVVFKNLHVKNMISNNLFSQIMFKTLALGCCQHTQESNLIAPFLSFKEKTK